ncbi:MAG TPA: TonB-dependent receptor [Moraxellaceae bacterium]
MRRVVAVLPASLLPLAVLFLNVPVHAQELQQLDEVVVTAANAAGVQRQPLPEKLPAVVVGLDVQQLQQTVNLSGVEDALKNLPAIDVRKRFIGDRSSPVASRTTGSGFGARGLVYADDVLLSNLLGNDNTTYTPRWSMVAPSELERVDVIYGPYSALYPGNAMGSVVQLSTRQPREFEAHLSVQGFREELQVYGTDDSYSGAQLAAALGARKNGFSLWLGANHLDSHGHPMSFATAQATSATPATASATGAVPDRDMFSKDRYILGATGIDHTVQENFKLKLGYDISADTTVSYTLGLWQNDSDISYDSYLRDANGNTVYAGLYQLNGVSYNISNTTFRLQQQEAEHWLHALALRHESGAWRWDLSASLYDYGTDESRVQATNTNGTGSSNGTLTRMDGTGWKTLDLRGEWQATATHALSLGYHFDHYTLQTLVQNVSNWVSSESGSRASAFSGETVTQALYLQDAWQFAAAWEAVLGLRYEQWQASNGTVSSSNTTQHFADRDDAFVSPKAALVWRVQDDLTLRASLARAYRLPTVAELYQGSLPNNANNVVYNNPDLQPEKVLVAELSAEYALAGGQLRGTLFNEDNEDALIRQTVPGVVGTTTYFVNVGKIRTQGAELAWQGRDVLLQRLDLNGSVTYARSEILEDAAHPEYVGKTNYRLPLWRARLVGTFRQTEKLDYSLAGRYSGRQYATLDSSDTNFNTWMGFASYTVFDAKANYRIRDGLRVSLGVDNLANRTYFQYHPYQGRTLMGEVRLDY